MNTLEQREQNLLNATETMAQFYDEIESFLTIMYSEMERAGFYTKTERLRSGTFTIKNLTRRLLASASIMYIKDSNKIDEDEEEMEDVDDPELEEKPGKDTDVTITPDMIIPLINIHLFTPRTIPTSHTLSSPVLLIGALGEFRFVDKKTGKPSDAASHSIGLSNLGQLYIKPNSQVGSRLGISCWKPKSMKNYKIEGKLLHVESIKLLEIDSQEKIKEIAKKLAGFCDVT